MGKFSFLALLRVVIGQKLSGHRGDDATQPCKSPGYSGLYSPLPLRCNKLCRCGPFRGVPFATTQRLVPDRLCIQYHGRPAGGPIMTAALLIVGAGRASFDGSCDTAETISGLCSRNARLISAGVQQVRAIVSPLGMRSH